MKCLILVALVATSSLFGQANFAQAFQNANKPTVQLANPLDLYEQAMRIKLMQEEQQSRQAQRELMIQNQADRNYRKGFEDGMKQGFENGATAQLEEIKGRIVPIGEAIIRNTANLIFKEEDPDKFRNLISQFSADLEKDPGDNMKKALLLLYRARLAELMPPTPPPAKAIKKKKINP